MRLKRRDGIQTVFQQGRYYRLGVLQAKAMPGRTADSRYLISVSKAVGTAPERNRLKRLVREAIRLSPVHPPQAYDVCLFVTRHPARAQRLADVQAEIGTLFGRLAAQP
ncbi:MAG TPA: ribonuclease P protein component [bacterium]|nr:ribonuclease P protein component [bacterium]